MPPPRAAQPASSATATSAMRGQTAREMREDTMPQAAGAAAPRAETARKASVPLSIDDWLARIRKLRIDGSADELAREIAAFRAAYPNEERRLAEELTRPLPSSK